MKLEAGKFYKTRGGHKAFVTAIIPDASDEGWPAVGWLLGDHTPRSWTLTGRNSGHDDLIAEWVEPKRIKGWVNICSSGQPGLIHETKREADRVADGGRLACIEIDCLEGDGL